jgi:hypothetical protein
MSTEAQDVAGTFKPASNVGTEYREATERLANASVAKHRADREFEEALTGYAEARGAAKARGLPT